MKSEFDIVIIGSGMEGSCVPTYWAAEGYSVYILEKNKQAGGSLQTYVRDRVIFDSGVHYLGGLGEGQNLYQVFKYLGPDGPAQTKKMDEDVFDKIIFENDPKEYVYTGIRKFHPAPAEGFSQ